jgi:rhodanese-related sulfurtransferase
MASVISKEFRMQNAVTRVPAAASKVAIQHFESQFTFETDCWDVHDALESDNPGFVLLDVRAPALFEKSHIPGAISLPHGKIVLSKMAGYSRETLFVTYCAGPHCNGAARGALRLAELGFAVKIMAGGITGWLDEGFTLASGCLTSSACPHGASG